MTKLETQKLGTGNISELAKKNKAEEPIKLHNPAKELTDEIKTLRQRNKEFAATNSHETYLIVVFSTKDDKNRFAEQIGQPVESGLTIVDGYEIAQHLNLEPKKPGFALHPPLESKRKNRKK